MLYKLLGFSQTGSVRHFRFVRITIDLPPAHFAVFADTSIARKVDLSVQDLPSLCSRLLAARADGDLNRSFVVTEAEMSACAEEIASAAALVAARRGRVTHRAQPQVDVTGTDAEQQRSDT